MAAAAAVPSSLPLTLAALVLFVVPLCGWSARNFAMRAGSCGSVIAGSRNQGERNAIANTGSAAKQTA